MNDWAFLLMLMFEIMQGRAQSSAAAAEHIETADEAAWRAQIKVDAEAGMALQLKMLREPRQYRSHLPEPDTPGPRPMPKTKPKRISRKERKLMDEYFKIVDRCNTGRLVFDPVSRFYVPELDAECVADPKKTTAKK
jgi:hypothetical protein